MRKLFALSTLALLLLGACKHSEDNPTAVSQIPAGGIQEAPADFRGQWAGDITTSTGTLPVSLTLSQSGSQVSGSFSSRRGSGSISGSVSGSDWTFTLTPTLFTLPCASQAHGTGSLAGNSMQFTLSGTGGTSPSTCATGVVGQGLLQRITSSPGINFPT